MRLSGDSPFRCILHLRFTELKTTTNLYPYSNATCSSNQHYHSQLGYELWSFDPFWKVSKEEIRQKVARLKCHTSHPDGHCAHSGSRICNLAHLRSSSKQMDSLWNPHLYYPKLRSRRYRLQHGIQAQPNLRRRLKPRLRLPSPALPGGRQKAFYCGYPCSMQLASIRYPNDTYAPKSPIT